MRWLTLVVAIVLGAACLAVCGTIDETCDVVDCSGRGTCVALQDGVYCACAPGTHAVALSCVPDGPAPDAGPDAGLDADVGD